VKKSSGIIALVLLIGFAFCRPLNKEIDNGQQSTAIIYASRYGSTAQTAEWIAEGMDGKADVISARNAEGVETYDHIILGSGIYNNDLHEDILVFLEKHKELVRDKTIAVFIVSGTPPSEAQVYLDMFAEKCGARSPLTQAFLGWLKKTLLTPEDLKVIEAYYQSIGQTFEDFDRTDKELCVQFGRKILQSISIMR